MTIWRFEEPGVDYGQLITGEYDIYIVTLSVLIACGAGYTALIVADRMDKIKTVGSKHAWLVVGASAMGLGIWAMHFTGMLAFMMDMPVGYSILVTILSGIPAILGSALVLLLLSSKSVTWQRNQACAFCLASCIALMHYTGMEAMRMPSILKYDVSYFVLSIVVAHLLASLALYIKYHEFNKTSIYKQYQNIFSAGVIGLSVSGMHYTAVGATRLYASDVLILHDSLISNMTLIISVISIVSLLLVIVITVAYIDKRIRMSFHSTRRRAEKTLRESEERFRSLVENAPVCIHEIDLDGRLTSMNQAGLEMMGIENEANIYGLAYLDVLAVEGLDHIRYMLDRAYGGVSSFFQYKTKGEGGPLFFESNFIPIKDSNNDVIKIMGVTQDVTAKQAIAEKAIKESEDKFLNIVEGSLQGIIVHRDFKPLFVNKRCADIFGYNNAEEILNLDSILEILWSPEERKRIKKYESLLMEGYELPISYECRGVRKDSSLFWFENNVSTIYWQGIKAIQIAVIDITDRKRANEQLSFQASHDSLTSLVNRREFEHRAERLLSTNQRDNSEHALCFMDLDQFKVVNDTCGHVAGDELLRQLSMLLKETVRHRDTLARLGGDEFGVLMEHCSLEAAHRVALSLQKAVQDYQFSWQGRSFKVGVSIGLVPITPDTNKLTELLKQADAACYVAKDKGRNRVHVYHAEDSEIAQHHGEMQWVTRLNQALDDDRFCLYAQPIMPLYESSDEHYEPLIRMIDEKGEIVLPGAFLPAAERYSLISKLDHWVIENAFGLLTDNPEFQKQVNTCSINLSGQSLTDPEIIEFIITQLSLSEINSEKICFEITETAAISNLSTAIKFISTLKGLGCRFALDDFGSGLSSFGYLKNLPVDYLKIDGMFVKNIIDDPIDRAMVKSINEIGQLMGMRAIAEFVENGVIKGMLKETGVNYAQGYGIGRPVNFARMVSGGGNINK